MVVGTDRSGHWVQDCDPTGIVWTDDRAYARVFADEAELMGNLPEQSLVWAEMEN